MKSDLDHQQSEECLDSKNIFRRQRCQDLLMGLMQGVREMEDFSRIQRYYTFGWTGQNSPIFPLPHLNQTVTFSLPWASETKLFLFWMPPSPALLSAFLKPLCPSFPSSVPHTLWTLAPDWIWHLPILYLSGRLRNPFRGQLRVASSDKVCCLTQL